MCFQIHNANSSPKSTKSEHQRTPGVGSDAAVPISNTKTKINGEARVSEVMEFCYVTERIIALWYKEDARGVLEHATSLLRGKHANNYMVRNLS